MEACGGTIRYNEGMMKIQLSLIAPPLDFSTANADKINTATEEARYKYLAAIFLSGVDVNIFRGLMETLKTDYLQGNK